MHENEGVETKRRKPARDFKSLFADDELGVAAPREDQDGPPIGSFRDNGEAARPVHLADHEVGKRSRGVLQDEPIARSAQVGAPQRP